MKKPILVLFCFLMLVLPVWPVFAQAPTPTPTKAEEEEAYDFTSMTTYEMFWPITAGKIPGDRFYNLKLWRDKMVGFLFFSNLKKSEYLKQLANKRLVEVEGLIEVNRLKYLADTLVASTANMKRGVDMLFAGEESQQSLWLKDEYQKDLQKHVIVLERMEKKVAEPQKEAILKATKQIRDLISEYKLEI